MGGIKQEFDLIVIGSGLAGTHAAILASNSGLKVALVEKRLLGGDSANYSDIPFGVLHQATNCYYQAQQTCSGVRIGSISFNFPTVKNDIKQAIASSLATEPNFYRDQGLQILKGNAYFLTPNKINIDNNHYRANKFIIATGAKWRVPKIAGISQIDFLTPHTWLKLNQLPKSIFIVGGHPTALFLAQTLQILGVEVYLSVRSERLLPEYDPEFSELIEKKLRDLGVVISTSSRVLETSRSFNQINLLFSHAGVERQLKVEQLLLAEELVPRLDLGLNNAVVEHQANGVVTNEFLQTSNKNIFACGDVLNMSNNSQTAILEAETALWSLTHNQKKSINYDLIPEALDLYPRLAKVGLTEDDCLKRDIKCKTVSAHYQEAPASLIATKSFGLIKIVLNAKKEIIGACAFGDNADNLINELALAISQKFTISDLLAMPHRFLSWQELFNVLANK